MATKLGLYNSALRELGSQKLSSLSEEREARYYLDDVYDDVVAECLEEGQWKFAIKSVEIEADENIDPTFGYAYAFAIPSDFVRLAAISASDRYDPPLTQYHEEAGYWWADITPLYVQYVSNAVDYGMNLGDWPQSFEDYVIKSLAERVCMVITQSDSKYEMAYNKMEKAKKNARSKDALRGHSKLIRHGTWTESRLHSRWTGRRYERA